MDSYGGEMKFVASCVAAMGISLILTACGGKGGVPGADLPADSPSPTVPAAPPPETSYRLLGTVEADRGEFADFALAGNRLFIAAGFDGIRIFDTSDLQAPRQVGGISPYGTTPLAPDNVRAIAASGKLAIASVFPGCAGFCWVDPASAGELRIYDISTPERPRQLSTVPIGAVALALQGTHLIALQGAASLMAGSGSSSPQTTLRVIDLTDPAAPQLLSTTSVDLASGLTLSGNRVFLGFATREGDQPGFQEIEISASGQVTAVAGSGVPPADTGENALVEVAGVIYAISGRPEYRIYQRDRPSGSLPTIMSLSKVARGMSALAGKLYITQEESGVSVFDLKTPLTPIPYKAIPADGRVTAVRAYPSFGLVRLALERTEGGTGSLVKPERIQFFSISD